MTETSEGTPASNDEAKAPKTKTLLQGNTPYRTVRVNGMLINPIIKGHPFINHAPNRRERRAIPGRAFSNKKGTQMVVTRIGSLSFVRYNKEIQRVMNKAIPHMKLAGI